MAKGLQYVNDLHKVFPLMQGSSWKTHAGRVSIDFKQSNSVLFYKNKFDGCVAVFSVFDLSMLFG